MTDSEVIRELAKQVAELAALPEQKEKIRLWKKHNELKPERPMFMIDQVCWGEMNVDNELTCVCTDNLLKGVEWQLRETLYRYKHMRDDRPIMPFVRVGNVWGADSFGPPSQFQDKDPQAQTHLYVDNLPDEESVNKWLKMPKLWFDKEETNRRFDKVREALGGILDVRAASYEGYFHYWDQISCWRGVEPIMYDIADNPDFIHDIVKRVVAMHMSFLDQVEELGLITPGMDIIHCTGAYNDKMQGYNGEPVSEIDLHTAKNTWTYSAPQLFSMVSPEMQDEFDIQYIIPWFNRFGYGYYGCCEPEDTRVEFLRKVPNLRKISMSPWANEENGAEKIGHDFVFSRKPNPANVAWDIFPEDVIRKEFEKTLAATTKNGCPIEFILKDITTVRNDPSRLWKWAEIARNYCK